MGNDANDMNEKRAPLADVEALIYFKFM